MRIIAGERRRYKLQAPAGLEVRPTSELVRGAAMSQLGGFFEGGHVLDLCAGTGAVALEFLSRGCARAVVVEHDPAVAAILRANATHTKLLDRIDVHVSDVVVAVAALAKIHAQFAQIWFDPPWQFERYAQVLAAIAHGELLAPQGVLWVQSRTPVQDLAPHWQCLDARRYGAGWLQRLGPVPP